ncbi:MAG: hypothetical protein FWG37_04905, partial [Clostridia bacterium]|nr:hypothetical protein [Clostridia bacterium]
KDRPSIVFHAMSDSTLLFFTQLGNCYPLAVSALQETNRPKERGTLLTGLLAGLEKDETPVRILCFRQGELEGLPDLLFFTQKGMIKRTEASQYVVRKSKFAAISLKGDDRLFDLQTMDTGSLMLVSMLGMVIHFPTDQIPLTGRNTAGVRGMSVDSGDRVAFAFQIHEGEGELLLVTDRGYAKKSLAFDFDRQNRAGKGLKGITFQKSGSNGTKVAGALYVREPFLFTIRQVASPPTVFSSEDVHIEERAGKGRMYVMALMGDDVVSVETGE